MSKKRIEEIKKLSIKAEEYNGLTRYSVFAYCLIWALAGLWVANNAVFVGIVFVLLPFFHMAYLGLRGLSHILNALVLILKAGNDVDVPSKSNNETQAQ
jgi:hypothetical protein